VRSDAHPRRCAAGSPTIVSARPAVIAGVSNDKNSSQHARARR
jgi:hypothetical protein